MQHQFVGRSRECPNPLGGATGPLFSAYQATLSSAELINPEELVKILQSPKGEKPLMIHVGSHVLLRAAHIPGSDTSPWFQRDRYTAAGVKRVEALPRRKVSSLSIADVVHGAIVRPSSLPTTRSMAMGFTT